jgi:predicted TIM-barrel fold metal-dependent hydrolase
MEPHDLWEKGRARSASRRRAALQADPVGESFQKHPGGQDPQRAHQRDGDRRLSAPRCFIPRSRSPIFALDDARMQEACFRVYNDWLMNYCSIAPKRLVGSAAISLYDSDRGIAEMGALQEGRPQRRHDLGGAASGSSLSFRSLQ